jgi:hypothetical protein
LWLVFTGVCPMNRTWVSSATREAYTQASRTKNEEKGGTAGYPTTSLPLPRSDQSAMCPIFGPPRTPNETTKLKVGTINENTTQDGSEESKASGPTRAERSKENSLRLASTILIRNLELQPTHRIDDNYNFVISGQASTVAVTRIQVPDRKGRNRKIIKNPLDYEPALTRDLYLKLPKEIQDSAKK